MYVLVHRPLGFYLDRGVFFQEWPAFGTDSERIGSRAPGQSQAQAVHNATGQSSRQVRLFPGRMIVLVGKCRSPGRPGRPRAKRGLTFNLKKPVPRDKGESLRVRVDRYRCIAGRCLYQVMSANTKVTKTKTALKQETYNLSDSLEWST